MKRLAAFVLMVLLAGAEPTRAFVVQTDRSPSGGVDLQGTALHEIGHILGLDHSGLGGTASRRPAMDPYDNREDPGAARMWKGDDIAGVGYLYPATAYLETGRISGTVRRQDGTGSFGVQVAAYDEAGRAVVGGLSGYRTGWNGSGEYLLAGLPQGRYTVGIEPLSGSITYANFGEVFNQAFDVGFKPKYYDNAAAAAQALPIAVSAGRETSGIDFSTGLYPPGFPVIQDPVLPANSPDPAGLYPVRATGSASSPPGPYGIAVSPDGTRLYVTLIHDNAVLALDPSTGSELSRIPVASQPRSLAMAPDGKRLYVTGLADGAGLSVIHTASARVEATVSVASSVRPFDAVVSPDQATVWVTDYTGSLLLVDATTNRVRKTLPVPGQNPRGIAMGLDGNTVLVANQDSDNLLVLEAATGRILQTVPAGQRPRDIALKDVADPLVSELISGTADFLLFADLFGKTR